MTNRRPEPSDRNAAMFAPRRAARPGREEPALVHDEEPAVAAAAVDEAGSNLAP